MQLFILCTSWTPAWARDREKWSEHPEEAHMCKLHTEKLAADQEVQIQHILAVGNRCHHTPLSISVRLCELTCMDTLDMLYRVWMSEMSSLPSAGPHTTIMF